MRMTIRLARASGLMMAVLIAGAACRPHMAPVPGDYLYVWAGDSARTASDFLAVVDASPTSASYGSVVGAVPVGASGTRPHHTEADVAMNGHLLANGFHSGRTWLYDLTSPSTPRILAEFGDRAGFSHPHSFVRMPDGSVLATFQYAADPAAAGEHAQHAAMSGAGHFTGGIVQMQEDGTVIRSGRASDASILDRNLFPYAVLPVPSLDRAISTTTDMDHADTVSTSQWVQLWRLSDLTLLKSIALPPGPRGDENQLTGEPRLLGDGRSAYIHTFNCGLYLVRGIEGSAPSATFVMGFPGKNCGVPVLAGHYWIQPAPALHAILSLDISDPEHPRQVSSLDLGVEKPHWLAIDASGRRLAINSAGATPGNRVYIATFDPATGALALDERFRDAGDGRPGVRFAQRAWPQGFTGTAVPHGTVFSR